MVLKHTERRRQPRAIFTTTIEYAALSALDTTPANTPLKGITVNISNTGLCILAFVPLRRGQKLKIINGLFPGMKKTAEVVWADKLSKDIYKAGLLFL